MKKNKSNSYNAGLALKWHVNISGKYFFEKNTIDRTKQNINTKKEELSTQDITITASNSSDKAIINDNSIFKIQNTNTNINSQNTAEEARKLADLCSSLEELRIIVQEFTGCNLKNTSLNTVFADGNPKAEIMLIGEAPGATEDEKGIPFCGSSGKLLDNILASIGLNRRNTYLTNIVFWRPPANRKPSIEEIEICKPFVERHIMFINPKLLIMVGSTAVESLLGLKLPMSKMRERCYKYSNQYMQDRIDTAIIYHPSYLLRNPVQKRFMWIDMIKISKMLDF